MQWDKYSTMLLTNTFKTPDFSKNTFKPTKKTNWMTRTTSDLFYSSSSKSFFYSWERKCNLILNAISPLLPSFRRLPFALQCGIFFLGGVQHSPVNSCAAVSCNFGVLTGEAELTSFSSAILSHRDWARPAFECLIVSCGGTGQQWPDTWAGALGAADLGMA